METERPSPGPSASRRPLFLGVLALALVGVVIEHAGRVVRWRRGGVRPAGQRQSGRHITLARAADVTDATGTGLLAAILFDAIAPGGSTLTLSGSATGPGGAPMGLQFRPVTVTVQQQRLGRQKLEAVQRQPVTGARTRGLSAGYAFVELLVVTTIIIILASAIMPLAKVTSTRQREAELRRALREMRTAIDRFKDAADSGQIGSLDIKAGSEGYPPHLEALVDGVKTANDATGRKLKFLRRIPVDPMTHSADWGLRSYQDNSDATRWGGQNVFDVRTTFDGTSLDGTKYRDW